MRFVSVFVFGLVFGLTVLASCSIDKVTFKNQDAGPEIDAPIDAAPIDTVDAGPVMVLVSTSEMTVPEGGQSMLSISLSGQPSDATLVNVMSADDITVGVVPTFLLFLTSNWATTQGVMVTGKEDTNVTDEQVNVAVRSDLLTGIISVTVHVTDNDGLAIVTTPSTMVEVSEGSNVAVAVRLSAQPTGNFTVNVASGSTAAATVAPATLTFTDVNWNIDQNVTVTGVDDVNTSNAATTLDLTGTGVPAVPLPLNVVDNDILGIQLSTTNLGSIAEGSTGTTFTVQLTQMPTVDVTINVGSTNALVATAAPAMLTFTPANWNSAQTVTVDSPSDGDTADAATTISMMATGLLTRTVAVAVTDDDVQAIVAAPNPVAVGEGGTAMFGVHLAFAPVAPVTVTVSSLNGTTATAGPATLTFTPANFATPQDVTVMGLQDPDAADTLTTIRLEDSIGGLITNVPLTVVDDEVLVLETSVTMVALGEAGTAMFQVRLSAMPLGSVTVNVTSGNESAATVGPATLTFTPANYMTYQPVTVTGVQDINLASESLVITLSASGFPVHTVTANVTDDDTQAVLVGAPTSTVPEGGSGMVGVSLMFQPSADVTVTVTSNNTAVATVGPATLTFTTTNYASPQNITIAGEQDANTVVGMTTISLTATNATPASVAVTVTDDDTLAIEADQTTVNVTEGAMAILRVRLTAEPAQTTTVMVASSNTLAATVAPASLSFTAANWMTYQNVQVSGVDDANSGDEMTTAILSGTGLSNVNVAVTVIDNDTQAIVTSTGSVSFVENGSAMFGVRLGAMPPGNVTVTVLSGDPGAATVSGSLTFTPANYNIDQDVTVTGVQDQDLAPESVMITLSSAGVANRVVTANVTDDDVQRVLVSQPTLTIGEGTVSGLTMTLEYQPASTVIVNLFSTNPAVATVLPAMLTFTPANYNIAQGASVSALQDPDTANGSTTITATSPGAMPGTVIVTVIDDDVAALELDRGDMYVEENGIASFFVRITAQPPGNVTVNLVSTDPGRAAPQPSVLTFTTTNWSTFQRVDVLGRNDDDVAHNGFRIDLISTMAPRSVRGTVIDDDLIAAKKTYLDVCSGVGFDTSVNLTGPPFDGAPHNGVLTVAAASSGAVIVQTPTFTFNTANYGASLKLVMKSNSASMPRFDTVILSAPGQQDVRIDVLLRPDIPGPCN